MWPVFQGLRVAPKRRGSVTGTIPFPYATGPGQPPTDPTIGPFQTAINFTPATILGEGIPIGPFSLAGAVNNNTNNLSIISQLTLGDIGIFLAW